MLIRRNDYDNDNNNALLQQFQNNNIAPFVAASPTRFPPALTTTSTITPEAAVPGAPGLGDFEDYLKSQNKRNIKQILCYASRYRTVLETGDASIILTQAKTPSIRRQTLEALAIYSKFCGKYNQFKDIRSKYQLGWGSANEDNLRYFTNYLQGNGNFEVMIAWLKGVLATLPNSLG
ncbi:MAG: hypothetical protein M3299_05115, partial [Thermoproteota archaeon]|nr:hypothetical protein [Thermoproteota archaeon]